MWAPTTRSMNLLCFRRYAQPTFHSSSFPAPMATLGLRLVGGTGQGLAIFICSMRTMITKSGPVDSITPITPHRMYHTVIGQKVGHSHLRFEPALTLSTDPVETNYSVKAKTALSYGAGSRSSGGNLCFEQASNEITFSSVSSSDASLLPPSDINPLTSSSIARQGTALVLGWLPMVGIAPWELSLCY